MTDDHQWMDRAVALSERGWGRTWPNPLVGAVLVNDGTLASEGWHAEYGGLHAEVVALREAGTRARGATMYTTLEPCTHTGKQPPCVPALIEAGVARVVIAARDPNPVARGGVEALRDAGIAVDEGIGAAEAERINFRYAHRWKDLDRPFVAVKLAVTLDGCIADAQGQARWVSGESAREWVHWLRAGFGAVGVGAATALHDGARLTVRGRVAPRQPPKRVVFDRSGRLDARAPIFAEGEGVMIVVDSSRAGALEAALRGVGAVVVAAGTIGDAMAELAAAGIDSLLVEGGGRLASALLRAGVVDRVYQVVAPLWLGEGVRAWSELGPIGLADASRWHTNAVSRRDDDVVIELEPR